MTADRKLLLIRSYDLWCHISEEEMEALNFQHHFIEAKKGDYIYFEAFHHSKLYFLKEGYIKIGYIDDDGNEVISEIIRQGEVFGQFTLEKSNLNGEFARAFKTDVSLCSFNVEDFEKILRNKPDIAIKYTKQVGNKLRSIQTRLVNLLNKDVRTRLINFFCQLLEMDPDDAQQPQTCIPNFLTHEDIAHLIGASRQTVTTLINEMAEEKLLVFSRQEICFPNVKMIRKLAAVG